MVPRVAEHSYSAQLEWTGNRGTGTSGYRAYGREYLIRVPGKPLLEGSSDPVFCGNADRHNPEDLLLSSVSACHMLWFLHLAADSGVVVTAYSDSASGVLQLEPDGSGRFIRIHLRPQVTVLNAAMQEICAALHEKANRLCFIANSLNFKIEHHPLVQVAVS